MKLSVTIGIPAHNEEQNIGNLLESVLTQVQKGYVIDKILVMCDGCTDNTYTIAYRIAATHPAVSVLKMKGRGGKMNVINRIFRQCTTDVCVILDADIVLMHRNVITELVTPYLNNPAIGLTGGNDLPYPGPGLFSRVTKTVHDIWYEIRSTYNNGDNVHNIHGQIWAVHRKVYEKCTIPAGINADDAFLYLYTKQQGYRYAFQSQAKIYYTIPDNLTEYFIQHSRYLGGTDLIVQHFGKHVLKEFHNPLTHKLASLLRVFTRNPLLFTLAILLQVLLRFMKHIYLQVNQAEKWQMITTSKQALNITQP